MPAAYFCLPSIAGNQVTEMNGERKLKKYTNNPDITEQASHCIKSFIENKQLYIIMSTNNGFKLLL